MKQLSKNLLFLSLSLVLLLPEQAFADYRRARALYAKRDYVEAADAYFKVYSKPKNLVEKRKSEWGLAESLQKIGLLYSSSKYYSIIVRRGRRSSNPFFRSAMEELGRINAELSLGQSHIVQLFKAKVRASDVPGPARGFYFYYKGVEAFARERYELAENYFRKVPSSSSYYLGAAFHLGVITNLAGRHSRAVTYFEKVLAGSRGRRQYQEIREMALLNIARVNYELKRFTQAIAYYGQIPRSSDNWLDALWEASWAFFFMQKFNNTLGNIHTLHSPFFENRFYPESYILQAITFLRLCRFSQVKESMRQFKRRYSPVYGDVKAMLNRYRGDPKGFYKLVYDYKRGRLPRFRKAEEIIKKLSLIDAFKGARDTIRFADREIDKLRRFRGWRESGLLSTLGSFLKSKKSAAVSNAGRRMFREGATYYRHLLDLSNQTKLIVAEMQLGKLQKLRSLINVGQEDDKVQFIGGLQKLKINETLEYWPFEGEYWEDELGFYVFNMESRCEGE
jgi:tetratricopeptide (TPR) repeat protein